MEGYDDDFESYTAGDLIAQSSNVWEAWSGASGGGADDASRFKCSSIKWK